MANTPIRKVTTDAGRTFTVRVLPVGARYGVNDACVIDDAPTVEFYDATYADQGGFGPLGQFVSRYHVAALVGRGPGGLDLEGGLPQWLVDAATMEVVRAWLTEVSPAPRKPVKTITRDEYARSKRHEYAGTARTLEPETRGRFAAGSPDWDGKHWAMWMTDRGTTLGPVNVRN